MHPIKDLLTLYFVMGSPNCKENPRHVLREAIEGGITLFQYREKGIDCLADRDKVELAKDLQGICREFNVPFIVNDDVDLAIELDADGVHIGQEDISIEDVRKRIGNKIIGVSAHSIEEALIAIDKGADYLGVGPMYATATKLDARKVQGPQLIRKMREASITIPIVGIGGITQSTVTEVINNGADGVAIISAISQSNFPKIATQDIMLKIK
ncbi:thiamine phosphate synthase [Paenisporosarcina sp. TG20]|uniref:thiamine phosphate synthase n=1 Tax=Paenisporosarcina sp. TG20 TaxID=1211706 RepID=UPI00031FCA9C|nr:thiamine phosphate synthase [Paenisporosarcina sp. TG20]